MSVSRSDGVRHHSPGVDSISHSDLMERTGHVPDPLIARCPCCGGCEFEFRPVLWDDLCREWGIDDRERRYIDLQQGYLCRQCGSSLRSMGLAWAMLEWWDSDLALRDFVAVQGDESPAVLEINEAGNLTHFLAHLPNHRLACYPDVDMQSLPFADSAFDIVLHSDSLEHVPDPLQALRECRRVLRPGGACLFTVPIIVDRLTRTRHGLPPSRHGKPGNTRDDYLVWTEFGADVWKWVIAAGFSQCRMYSFLYPSVIVQSGIV